MPRRSRDLLAAIENWGCRPRLLALYERLNGGNADGRFRFRSPAQAAAPLPRAPQWCDGSAFLNHGALMQTGVQAAADCRTSSAIPLMYQGGSDDLLGAARRHRGCPTRRTASTSRASSA